MSLLIYFYSVILKISYISCWSSYVRILFKRIDITPLVFICRTIKMTMLMYIIRGSLIRGKPDFNNVNNISHIGILGKTSWWKSNRKAHVNNIDAGEKNNFRCSSDTITDKMSDDVKKVILKVQKRLLADGPNEKVSWNLSKYFSTSS